MEIIKEDLASKANVGASDADIINMAAQLARQFNRTTLEEQAAEEAKETGEDVKKVYETSNRKLSKL